MSNPRSKFAIRLREARKAKYMTQKDLALELDVNPQSVAWWEIDRCNPRMDKLPQIADVLGVSVGWLLGADESRTKWISVEERLPEECEDVLAFHRNNNMTWVETAHVCNKRWYRKGVPIFFVTHWMPLPEPPKEG